MTGTSTAGSREVSVKYQGFLPRRRGRRSACKQGVVCTEFAKEGRLKN